MLCLILCCSRRPGGSYLYKASVMSFLVKKWSEYQPVPYHSSCFPLALARHRKTHKNNFILQKLLCRRWPCQSPTALVMAGSIAILILLKMPTKEIMTASVEEPRKNILLLGGWTPYYDGIAPNKDMTCTEKGYRCNIATQAKSWLFSPQPDASNELVVFHESDLTKFPPRKHFGQLWVMRTGEAQRNLQVNTENWNSLFNYTVDHREDASIRTYSLKLEALDTAMTRNFYNEKLQMTATEKLRPSTLWLVSNCLNVESGREEFVSELKKLIMDELSVYTHSSICSLKWILKSKFHARISGQPENMKNYTFYLAFENALCKDYITEKFWKILTDDSLAIPVVMGGLSLSDYESIAPPNSFIHVKNFSSPLSLANHLKFVASNPKAFNYYHQWRNTHKLVSRKYISLYLAYCHPELNVNFCG